MMDVELGPPPTRVALGRRIQELRKHRRWTQAQLAELAGMRREDVCRVERANVPCWPAWRERLARAFNINPEVFEVD